jgi:hypothetical protein
MKVIKLIYLKKIFFSYNTFLLSWVMLVNTQNRITSKRYPMKRFKIFSLIIASAFIFYSCDTFQEDEVKERLEIGNPDIILYSEGSGIFSLSNTIRSTQRIKFGVSSPPQKGQLQDLGHGMFHYSPSVVGSNMKDNFRISIFGLDNQLLNETVVTLFLTDTPADLDCGIFPRNDEYYYKAGSGEIDLHVLKNDLICSRIDTADLYLELPCIATAITPCPPYWGTARVVNERRIRFSSTLNEGVEKFIYSVKSKKDSNLIAFGYSYIYVGEGAGGGSGGGGTCVIKANSDLYSFKTDTANYTVLNLISNDGLCNNGGSSVATTILKQPLYGTLSSIGDHNFKYTKSNSISGSYSDALVYQLCVGNDCHLAQVIINVIDPTCSNQAVNDVYYLIPSQINNDHYIIDVALNDCSVSGNSILRILTPPTKGIARIDEGSPKKISYYPGAGSFTQDQFEYEISLENGSTSRATVKILKP